MYIKTQITEIRTLALCIGYLEFIREPGEEYKFVAEFPEGATQVRIEISRSGVGGREQACYKNSDGVFKLHSESLFKWPAAFLGVLTAVPGKFQEATAYPDEFLREVYTDVNEALRELLIPEPGILTTLDMLKIKPPLEGEALKALAAAGAFVNALIKQEVLKTLRSVWVHRDLEVHTKYSAIAILRTCHDFKIPEIAAALGTSLGAFRYLVKPIYTDLFAVIALPETLTPMKTTQDAFPKSWWGKQSDELKSLIGIPDVIQCTPWSSYSPQFIHTKTYEAAIRIAEHAYQLRLTTSY